MPIVVILPEVPASPEYSPEFHTPSIEVQSLGSVSSAPTTPEPIPVPPPCCSNPPPPRALLVPIEEVTSDAEDSDTIAKRAEEALNQEVTLGFLNWNKQGQGAHRWAVCSLSHHAHPYTHQIQPGDYCPRRRGGIFNCLN